MKDLSRYNQYIGCKVENNSGIVTDLFSEGDKVFAIINDDFEAEFDSVIFDLINGGEYVRIK